MDGRRPLRAEARVEHGSSVRRRVGEVTDMYVPEGSGCNTFCSFVQCGRDTAAMGDWGAPRNAMIKGTFCYKRLLEWAVSGTVVWAGRLGFERLERDRGRPEVERRNSTKVGNGQIIKKNDK